MTIKTFYPHTVSQTSDSGNSYREFNNLSNVKNSNDTYAKTGQIASKSGTHKRPSAITAKNFKANIPSGSTINSVTVEYAADYEGNISIGKSTINILNISGDNKSGKALTKTMTKTSATLKGNHTIANINSSNFGVKISFPANTKSDVGYVKVKYIRIIIDYTEPNFSVSASKTSGTYTNDEFKFKITASNVNKTNNSTNVTIYLPSKVSYVGKDTGDGGISANGSRLSWNPGLSSKKVSASIVLKVKITTDGVHSIFISESVTGHKTSLYIPTSSKPTPTPVQEIIDETPEIPVVNDKVTLPTVNPTPQTVMQVAVNEEFSLDLNFEDYSDTSVKLYAYFNDYTYDTGGELMEDVQYSQYSSGRTDKIQCYYMHSGQQWSYGSVNFWDYYNKKWTVMNYTLTSGMMQNLFKITQAGYYTIHIYSSDGETLLRKVLIAVKPEITTNPLYTIFKLTEEEINRLGQGIVYTVQSYLKLTTAEPFVRDWNNTFKMGVFNNRIESNIEDLASFSEFNDGAVTATLNVPENAINYIIQSDNEINTVETENTITFSESDENKNVTVNINFLDSEENIIVTGEYFINFDENSIILLQNDYDPTDYTNLTLAEIYENAEYSNLLDAVNEFKSVTCDFVYNSQYPVYILVTGDVFEGNPIGNTIVFTEPAIIESDTYNGYESNGNYPLPILNVINESAEEASNISLSSFEESSHVLVYTPQLPEEYGTDETIAIRGIEITGDIDYSDDLILFAKLKVRHDNEYLTGNRSVVIKNNDNNLQIGGKYDTWGLRIGDLINLDKLELELGVNNILKETDAQILLKNLKLTIYVNPISYTPYGVIVEDEEVSWYGMDVTNFEIPFGRKTETKYLNIEGTDTNIAYRQNIQGKPIKIYFNVDGCDLEETTEQVQQLAKLFTNDRDELNSPIPKRIRFTHIPNKFFYYILEDTFDTDIAISDYKGSIEIFIPEGTASDIEDTVTNVNGYVEGIASVNPIIAITHITSNQLSVSEMVKNPLQTFKLNKDNLSNTNIVFEVNDTIVINCITRTCNLIKADETETIDITEAVDFNSDWFKIQGEFEFKSENCVIKTVTYNTRS